MMNNIQQQTKLRVGPIAQQLEKIQTNGDKPQSDGQQPLANQPQKRATKWKWGFSNKTGWEWLNLIGILLVPLTIGMLTVFNGVQQSQTNQQQHSSDQRIALDQQQETALATYLDTMTNLILKNNLYQSKSNDEVSILARVQTLTVLRRIDPNRKEIVLHFLFESGLIRFISLDDADLSGIREISLRPAGAIDLKYLMLQYAYLNNAYLVNLEVEQGSFFRTDMSFSTFIHVIVISSNFIDSNLSHIKILDSDFSNSRFLGADLSNSTLSNVILRNTDLSNVNLSGAELIKVDLRGAKITLEQLAQAKSLQGTIMPDGTVHS